MCRRADSGSLTRSHQPREIGGHRRPMIRTVARTRAFPILAWAFLLGLGVQIFFAGMYVFVGASNIELHRSFAHVLLATSVLLTISVFVGRVPEKRMLFVVLGLFTLQGMLVHVNQWFGLSMVAALHPVNAVVMAYATLSLAKRSSAYWAASEDREPMRVTGSMQATA
jgi:hypothetical protein